MKNEKPAMAHDAAHLLWSELDKDIETEEFEQKVRDEVFTYLVDTTVVAGPDYPGPAFLPDAFQTIAIESTRLYIDKMVEAGLWVRDETL